MKQVRQIVVMLGLCAVLSGTLSSLMANPVEDAAKIARYARTSGDIIAYITPGHSVQTEYRSWDSLTLCGGSIYTPIFRRMTGMHMNLKNTQIREQSQAAEFKVFLMRFK